MENITSFRNTWTPFKEHVFPFSPHTYWSAHLISESSDKSFCFKALICDILNSNILSCYTDKTTTISVWYTTFQSKSLDTTATSMQCSETEGDRLAWVQKLCKDIKKLPTDKWKQERGMARGRRGQAAGAAGSSCQLWELSEQNNLGSLVLVQWAKGVNTHVAESQVTGQLKASQHCTTHWKR